MTCGQANRSGCRWTASVCRIASILAVLGMAIAGGAAEPKPDVRRDATVSAVERVLSSVVNIGTVTMERADPYEEMLREFFGYRRRAPDTVYSSGSGVIIDEEGWVVTNYHVVRDATGVRVTLADSTETLDAEVVSVSEANDLALLRLQAKAGRRFKAVVLGADDDLLLGETVLALGNPYGLGGSVSRGILSSKTRRQERDGDAMEVEDWLQTDASINPGNSGGPLVNLKGELIGLNVAVLARAQGIGFAIPVKRISAALSEMLSPEVTRGLWFGATLKGTYLPLMVTEIQRGSPAEKAGLEPGDEILGLDGSTPRTLVQFHRMLGSAGREVALKVRRGDRKLDLGVTLLAEKAVFNGEFVKKRLGATLERIPEDLTRQLNLRASSGLWVTSIERGGPAEKAGLVKGCIVTAVDGQPAGNLVVLGRALNRKRSGDPVVLDILAARRRGTLLQLNEGKVQLKIR